MAPIPEMGQSEKENWLTSHEKLVDKRSNDIRKKKFLLGIKCDGLVVALLSDLTLGSKLVGGSIWGLEGNRLLWGWYQGYLQNLTDAEQKHHILSSNPHYRIVYPETFFSSNTHLYIHFFIDQFFRPSHSSVGKPMIFVLFFFLSFIQLLIFFFIIFYFIHFLTFIRYCFLYPFFSRRLKLPLNANNNNIL